MPDCSRRKKQRVSDLLIRFALREQLKNLELATGEVRLIGLRVRTGTPGDVLCAGGTQLSHRANNIGFCAEAFNDRQGVPQ